MVEPMFAGPVADALVNAMGSAPVSLETIKSRASKLDDRAEILPPEAIEAILRADDRAVETADGWVLAHDAAVPGASSGARADPFAGDPDHPLDVSQIDEFAVLDIESTGLDPSAEIIEVAALRVRDWNVVGEFQTLVRIEVIPPAISALTGIESPHLVDAPPVTDAVGELAQFIGGLPMMGQNLAFDLGVLQRIDPAGFQGPALEVLELAHMVFPRAKSRALGDLAEQLGMPPEREHRAAADCRTTLKVAGRLLLLIADGDKASLMRHLLARARNPWSRLLPQPSDDLDPTHWLSNLAAPWTRPPASRRSCGAPGAADVFGPGKLLDKAILGIEPRPSQVGMAHEVQQTFEAGGRLLVEAPTGTGKTYAYLVPAVRQASNGRPVWISTHTKALQTQLEHDFERLRSASILDGSLAVLKGQENYLCPRDLLATLDVDLDALSAVEAASLLRLLEEADDGEVGEATDFWLTSQSRAAADLKASVTLNPATCDRAGCDFFNACPFYAAARRANQADLVVVNHALLATLLAQAERPPLGGLVVDEAHTLEEAVVSQLTDGLSPGVLVAWIDRLIDARHSSGLLRNVGRAFGLKVADSPGFGSAVEACRRTRKALRILADRLATYLIEFVGAPRVGEYPITHRFRRGIDDRRFLFLEARQALFVTGELLKELTQGLWDLHRETSDLPAAERFNAASLRRRLRAEAAHGDELTELCLTLLTLGDTDFVVYATWEPSEDEMPRLTITRSPIDVTDVLTSLYAASPSVVATSATLSVTGSFDFMRERLAAPDFTAIELGATFDYEEQAGLILTRHLPPPRTDRESEFVRATAETAIASIGTSRGGALGLFTSRRRVAEAFQLAEPGVRYEGLDLRAQIPGTSTRELADWFRDQEDSSLFGLRSFWEGFDAPGDTLRLLLIEKIPFPSPADPLVAARSERMELQQRDPFYELAVPMAALVFKQGFGRLIRSRNDRGVVVVLDRRMRTGLTYQGEFLASLPPGLPIEYPTDELDYLETLARLLDVEPRLDLATGVGPARSVIDLSLTTVTEPHDHEALDTALRRVLDMFQMSGFRPGQEELIRAVIADNRDVVGLLPTGAGKSLVYQTVSMCLDGVGLVISPLVALMKDQVDTLRNDLGFLWAFALVGGQTAAERDEVLDAVRQGGCRLLYVSPERLRDANLINALKQTRITYIAVDEAHCVSVWGHDFRPDFLSIVPSLTALNGIQDVPRLALTATAPAAVLTDICEQLQLRDPHIERRSVDRPNLHFSVIGCRNRKEKRAQLLRVALAHSDTPGIVYCPTRAIAEATAALFRSHDISARHYHAGMPPEQRDAVQEMFMADQTQIICATNAFGLGVDKPNVGFVAHWAPPFSLDAYFQEAGRAARDPALQGNAVLLWTRSDQLLIRRLLNSTLPTIEDLQRIEHEIGALAQPYISVERLATKVGLDETSVRVGIHLLHRAGAIEQGVDVGEQALLAVPNSIERIRQRFGDETARRIEEITTAASMAATSRRVIDVLAVASQLGMPAGDLDLELRALADREVVGYRPFRRAMALQYVSSEWDHDAVAHQLKRLQRSSYDRFDAMLAYATSRGCRRHRILEHFGETPGETCGNCDECTGEPAVLAAVDPIRYADTDAVTEQVAHSIIGLVQEASRLGSAPGRGSFTKALKGVRRYGDYRVPEILQRSRHFGSLAYMTEDEIGEAIDILLDQRRLMSVEHGLSSGSTYWGLDVPA